MEIKREYVDQMNKIRILNYMATSFASFLEEKLGVKNFVENVDLNCGVIPEGSFTEIIDENAIEEYLSLYTKISLSRFSVAVTSMLKFNPDTIKLMTDFSYDLGKKSLCDYTCLDDAYNTIKAYCFIKEGAKVGKTYWWSLNEEIKPYFMKLKTDDEAYFILEEAFIKGLLSKSTYTYRIEEHKGILV